MLLTFLTILTSVVSGWCFMGGAPDYTCRDPSVFHTRKINATHEGIIMPRDMGSNPFALEADSNTFKPGQRVTVSVYTRDPRKLLKGFFIQAVQANIAMRDLHRRAFGTFTNTTTGEHPSVCQSSGSDEVGGITHTSNSTNSVVRVVWIAPKELSPGRIQFLATGVLDYNTYWTNIRSPVLQPQDYTLVKEDNTSSPLLTPTAAWYQWLHYLNTLPFRAPNSNTDPQGKSGDVFTNVKNTTNNVQS